MSGLGFATTAWSNDPFRALEVVARPDARKSLSEGAVVKASLVARLLGLRLLSIDADVILLPAEAAPVRHVESLTRPAWDGAGREGTLDDAAGLLARASRTIRETQQYRI